MIPLHLARLEKEKAYERYNYAARALEVAQIKERMAELANQHEPLASRTESREERKRTIAAVFYAVYGRWPKDEELS